MLRETTDEEVLNLVHSNPNLLVPHFIIHSYLYYVVGTPAISDATFDRIVKSLDENWDRITHRHKDRIDRSILKSGFYLIYPEIAKGAALRLMEDLTAKAVKAVKTNAAKKRKPRRKGPVAA